MVNAKELYTQSTLQYSLRPKRMHDLSAQCRLLSVKFTKPASTSFQTDSVLWHAYPMKLSLKRIRQSVAQ